MDVSSEQALAFVEALCEADQHGCHNSPAAYYHLRAAIGFVPKCKSFKQTGGNGAPREFVYYLRGVCMALEQMWLPQARPVCDEVDGT